MEFVDYNLALKLKEKEFDEECLAYYTSEYTLYLNKVVLCDDKYLEVAEIDYEECLCSYNTQKDRLLRTIVDSPTISQVLKWLREEKLILIGLYPIENTNDEETVEWCSTVYKAYKQGGLSWQEEFYYPSYEQAAIAGIEYVLDNLI